MKRKKLFLFIPVLAWICFMLLAEGCKHEPICPPGVNCLPGGTDTTVVPIDTTGGGGTDTTHNPPDTVITGRPCDPDTVYFSEDILPLLISNCALSGCHDAASAQDGVILTDYNNVFQTGDIEPFRPDKSDLFEAITDTDPDKKMPPPPRTSLTNAQIELIRKWILQGAQDLSCGLDTVINGSISCDTIDVSFSQDIAPVLATYCVGCHSGGSPAGGIDLSTHAGVRGAAQSGLLYGSVAWLPGFKNMPQGGQQLSACRVAKIKAWVDEGAKDN